MWLCLKEKIRTCMGLLALGALLAQGLVPAGFMPASGADGFSIEICTASGLKTVSFPGDSAPAPHSGKDAHDHSPCPYAPVFSHAAFAPAQPVLAPPPRMAEQKAMAARDLPALAVFLAYNPRGPPARPA